MHDECISQGCWMYYTPHAPRAENIEIIRDVPASRGMVNPYAALRRNRPSDTPVQMPSPAELAGVLAQASVSGETNSETNS